MLGMHGTAYANKAMCECDLLLNVGSRFDDRIIGQPDKFCAGAKIVHIDIDPAEMDKMIRPDVQIIGDAKAALALLNEVLTTPLETTEWRGKLDGYKKKFPLSYKKQGGLRMQQVIEELYEQTEGKAIVSTDVGTPDVGRASSTRQRILPLVVLRWSRNDGVRLPGRNRRAARPSGEDRDLNFRRRRIPDDSLRTCHRSHSQTSHQDCSPEQSLSRNGASVAGTLLRQPGVRCRPRWQSGLLQARRGIRNPKCAF
ncbi:UNVERIFIED_CONTAM: hypothetical protein GTU68_056063 [Idotea baltica]|nr:hypothetical protein [Idotea baltica]